MRDDEPRPVWMSLPITHVLRKKYFFLFLFAIFNTGCAAGLKNRVRRRRPGRRVLRAIVAPPEIKCGHTDRRLHRLVASRLRASP